MITKFTVDWNTWRCGGITVANQNSHGQGETKLLNEEGFRCCLGFVENQLGVPDEKILKKPYPYYTQVENILCYVQSNAYFNTILANKAARINDDKNISHAERIFKLQQLFKKENLELEFINVPKEIQNEINSLQSAS